jgi:HNH endonuclease
MRYLIMNFLDPKLPDRFLDKVIPEPNSGCWIWTASTGTAGYGQFKDRAVRTAPLLAHRVAYEALVGAIPDGLKIDHRVCQNRLCCNPRHLEAVTSAINAQRAGALRDTPTECKNGHAFSEENTYVSPRGSRGCKTCRRRIDRIRDATPKRSYAVRQKGHRS